MKKIIAVLFVLCISVFNFSFISNANVDISSKEDEIVKTVLQYPSYYGINKSDNEKIELLKEHIKMGYTIIYDMFKEDYPELTEEQLEFAVIKKLVEKTNSAERSIKRQKTQEISVRKSESIKKFEETDEEGYLKIINFINKNLSPSYVADTDTARQNIDILKNNKDKIPEDMKGLAELYISDMEASLKYQTEHPEKTKYVNKKVDSNMSSIIDSNMKKRDASLTQKPISSIDDNNPLYNEDPRWHEKIHNYIEKYADEGHYNSAFPDWTFPYGDCANFVSQCLNQIHPMFKIDDNIDNSDNWFSYGNVQDDNKVSRTWRGADLFKWHWVDFGYGFKDFYLNAPNAVELIYNYAEKGLPISFFKKGKKDAFHTAIIYDMLYNSDKSIDIKLAQHTPGTKERLLSGISKDYVLRVYQIYPYR